MAIRIIKSVPLTRLTIPSRPQTICFLFSTSRPPPDGSTPDTKITSTVSVLTHIRSKSRWGHLRALFPDGFSPAEFSRVVVCIRNNAHLALRFFDFTRRHSLCEHSVESYAALVHVLARARLKGQACSLIKEAMRVEEPVRAFEVLVKTYRECGSAPFVFDLLIRCCLEAKKIDEAVTIARLLMSRGISPNVGTCNSLIQCVSKSRGALSGYEIYRELFGLESAEVEHGQKRVARVLPNVQIFNTLMLCCYRDGATDRVKEIWSEMSNRDCAPNAYSYSILMTVYCEDGNMVEAERLWSKMKIDGVEADVMTFNTIIGGLCKVGDIDRAEELFREMECSEVKPTSTTYDHLISGYCKFGEIDTAILLYKDMRRRSFVPEELTVDAMVTGLCGKGRVYEALPIMRGVKGNPRLSPKMTTYEVMIRGLCEEGAMEEALKVQAEMVGRGFQPNLLVYSAFIDGYVKQGNKEMADRLRKEIQDAQQSQHEVLDDAVSRWKPLVQVNET